METPNADNGSDRFIRPLYSIAELGARWPRVPSIADRTAGAERDAKVRVKPASSDGPALYTPVELILRGLALYSFSRTVSKPFVLCIEPVA